MLLFLWIQSYAVSPLPALVLANTASKQWVSMPPVGCRVHLKVESFAAASYA